MYLKISYNDDFDQLMLFLKSKYGAKLFDLDGIGKQLDIRQFSRDFFSTNTTAADCSVDENANVDIMDSISYIAEMPKPLFRLNSYFLLWKKLKQLYGHLEANKIIEMQLVGDIYINDFSDVQRSYCFNFSTYDIMVMGLPMIKKIKSIPPKFLYSFKSQLEQFVVIGSNSILGATGLADMFIVMSHYVEKLLESKSDAHFNFETEDDCWRYIKENLASFVYTVNQPQRGGIQSPFTNVSVYDEYFLKSLLEDGAYKWNGRSPNIEVIKKVQELFLDVMNTELTRTPVTFPIVTACFCIDKDNNIQDENFVEMIAEKNKDFGFINIYSGSSSTLSSCCRLRSDTSNEYFNNFGAGSSKIGSLGVVTLNLPRMAYKAVKEPGDDPKKKFLELLEEAVNVVGKINNSKRHILRKRIEAGNMPLYSLGFISLDKQYSTVGVNGINEACEILGLNILEENGQEFVLQCLNNINGTNDKLQKQYSSPHNVEQTPSESSAIKLAAKDHYLGYNKGEYKIYSNQFIPLTTTADMLDRIRLQGMFDSHFSGGAILHVNIGQKVEDTYKLVDLIKACAKKGVVYWAANYNLQRCGNDHMTVGNNSHCAICGGDIIENYSRVVGFLTAIKNWNKIRREEDYPKRQWYNGGLKKVVGELSNRI